MDKLTEPELELYNIAQAEMKHAYVPYSHFQVAAVLRTKSGQIFKGVNVENASFGLTNCAERSCIFNYISAGSLADPISEFLIIGGTDDPISPCGACRQVLSEFLPSDATITLTNLTGAVKHMTMVELLPYYFKQEDLND